MDRSYSYLPDSLIETITDNISPDSSEGFTYDDYSRLSSAAGAYGGLEYILDLADNRLMVSQDAGSNSTYQYIPGTNLVSEYNTGQATVTCSYDQHGNMVRKGDLHFVYNHRNRLVKVTDREGSTIVEYGYNALGQRIFKKRPSGTVFFLYDPDGNLVMEYDVEAQKAVEYLWLGSRPVARIDISHLCTDDKDMDGDVDGRDLASSLTGSPDIAALAGHFGDTANPAQTESVYFYHTDHLGTPQVITDSAGSVVWRADYLPFGKTILQSMPSIENNLRFPGQYYDEEIGLHYNWHRYYDPETGRYLTPDPIGLAGGMNLYVYASVNTINVIDPRGLKTTFAVKMGALQVGIGGIIGNATAFSDCVNGNRYVATYNVWGGTLGAGVNIRGLKNIIPWLTKNLTSALLGKTFEIEPNYPPQILSWLDAEGPSASFLYGVTIIDMEVSPHEGGRGKGDDVKIVSYGFSGDIGIQLSSVSGITLIRNMIKQEDCCEQK